MTGFAALFLVADGVAKLFKPAPVVEGTVTLGYPESTIVPLGILLVSCTDYIFAMVECPSLFRFGVATDDSARTLNKDVSLILRRSFQ